MRSAAARSSSVADLIGQLVVGTLLGLFVCFVIWVFFVARPQVALERDEEERQRAERSAARQHELEVRMAAFGAYQSQVVGSHAADVEEWCLWVANEPALDRPTAEWHEWLRAALPIYLLAGEPPDACWGELGYP